jgi:hypothetical protein
MAVDLNKLVRGAMTAAAGSVRDAVRPITYKHVTGSPVYDPVTGGTITPTTEYQTRGVIARYRSRDIDGSRIQASDLKLLIAYDDLPVAPKLTDHAMLAGVRWNVHNLASDPAGALHILQMRKP